MAFVEQINKRTKNAKHYQDSVNPNKFAIDASIGAIHYHDGEQWQDIDTTLEPSIAPWDWQMVKSGYHVHVLEDFTAGQVIEFEKQGESVAFQPMALQYSNDLNQIQQISMPTIPSGVTVENNKILWHDAYGEGLDFSWSCMNTRLLKLLTIDQFNNLPAIEQYIIDGGNPCLELNLIFDPSPDLEAYVNGAKWDKKTKKSTFGIIEWKKDSETIFGFMPNWYWDANGNNPDMTPAQTVLSKSGNKFYVSIRIPYSWVESATYPIYIDATIDDETGAQDEDMYMRLSDTSCNISSNDFWIGDYNGSAKGYGVAARFQITENLAGVTIGSGSYLGFYAMSNQSGNTCNARISAEDAESAVAYTSTWADEYARFGNHTTARIDWDGIAAWTSGNWYDTTSVNISSVIQELIDSGFGYSNNYMGFYIEDFDYRSSAGAIRNGDCYFGASANGIKLHIEYTAGGGLSIPIAMHHYTKNIGSN